MGGGSPTVQAWVARTHGADRNAPHRTGARTRCVGVAAATGTHTDDGDVCELVAGPEVSTDRISTRSALTLSLKKGKRVRSGEPVKGRRHRPSGIFCVTPGGTAEVVGVADSLAHCQRLTT